MRHYKKVGICVFKKLDELLDEFESIPNGDTLSVFSDDLFPNKNINSDNQDIDNHSSEIVNE